MIVPKPRPAGSPAIYLDHNATTPLDPRVLDAMLPFELAALPHAWFKWIGLPVVSYALPALILQSSETHSRYNLLIRSSLCPSTPCWSVTGSG